MPNTDTAPAFAHWIGRSKQSDSDTITPRLCRSLGATVGRELSEPDSISAACVHWCLAPDIAPADALGHDGHPAKGDFLPPVSLPRRMWAGGRLSFHHAFALHDEVHKTSTIQSIRHTRGSTGELVFVTVEHNYSTARGLALCEQHDIVYREAASANSASPEARINTSPFEHEQQVAVDATTLFRYSALTFNGHRIHYDQAYATAVEHYPGLVIHGPLQASYLMQMAHQRRGTLPSRFEFRGVAAACGEQQLTLRAAAPQRDQDGEHLALWVCDQQGCTTMTAQAHWSPADSHKKAL